MKRNLRNQAIGWAIGLAISFGTLAIVGAWDNDSDKASPETQEQVFQEVWSETTVTDRADICLAFALLGEDEVSSLIAAEVPPAVDVDYMVTRFNEECRNG